jgi:hypothetical protein
VVRYVQNGRMAERQNGRMAEWQNSGTVEWKNGENIGMAERQNGRMADGRIEDWQNGGMAEWLGRMADGQLRKSNTTQQFKGVSPLMFRSTGTSSASNNVDQRDVHSQHSLSYNDQGLVDQWVRCFRNLNLRIQKTI